MMRRRPLLTLPLATLAAPAAVRAAAAAEPVRAYGPGGPAPAMRAAAAFASAGPDSGTISPLAVATLG